MDIKRLIPIVSILFTNMLGATIIFPILPIYSVNELNSTIIQAALLASAYFGAQFVGAPILGRLSDRYGRRPLLIASQAGTALAFVLFIFALPLGSIIDGLELPFVINGGLFVFYVARILDGVTGGNISIAQAYVADISTNENRVQMLGLLSASASLGFIFGPATGGILAASFGLTAPFIAGTIVATGTLILTVVMLVESHPPEQRTRQAKREHKSISTRQIFSNPAFVMVIGVGFLSTLCFAALPPTFVLYADAVLFPDVSDTAIVVRNVGLIFTMIGIVSVITQGTLLKPLVNRFGERKLITAGQIILALVFLAAPLTTSPIILTLVFLPFAFGRGISEPSLQSLVTRFGDKQTQGQLLGIYQSTTSLAFIFGPIWAGYVFENISPQALWWVGAAILIPAIMLAYRLSRRALPALAVETE